MIIKRTYDGQIIQYLDTKTNKMVEQQIVGLERGQYMDAKGEKMSPEEGAAFFVNTQSSGHWPEAWVLEQVVKAIPSDIWSIILAKVAPDVRRDLVRRLGPIAKVAKCSTL
jgi:hypothetical protein